MSKPPAPSVVQSETRQALRGYDGPIARITRADGESRDFWPGPDGRLDMAEVERFAAGQDCTVLAYNQAPGCEDEPPRPMGRL